MPALSRRAWVIAGALIAIVLLVVAIVVLRPGSGAKHPADGPSTSASSATVERGPTVYVTNLTTAAVTVQAWDGAAPFTLDAGLGRQLPRAGAPDGPWHVRMTGSTGASLYDASLADGSGQQVEVLPDEVKVIDLVHEQDANEAEDALRPGPMSPSAPPDGSLVTTTKAFPAVEGKLDIASPDNAFTSAAFGSPANRVELASGLIPPNRPGCDDPKGRTVVSDWGTLSFADTGGGAAPTDIALPSPTGDLAYQIYGDPQIVRLRDGDLAYLRVVGLFTPVTPKPAWFTYNNSYWRGGLAIWRSHCGNDWKLATTLDANAVYDGQCAWPQGSDAGHWFGGFDRPEMYTDPVTGTVYVSTYCTGGTAPAFPASQAFDHAFVLRWDPASGAWAGGHDLKPHQAPNTVSSSPGPLAMFRCEGWPTGPAEVYRSADGGDSFDAGIDLSQATDGATCQNNPRGLTDQLGYYTNAPDFGVARIAPDSVRLVYPSVVDGRQELRVDDVLYPGGNFPNGLFHRAPIVSDWPDGSIGHFTLIEEDATYPGFGADDRYTTLLAWTEYSPAQHGHRERALLFHGQTQVGSVIDLSSGTWAMGNTKAWGGDYEYGGFGFWGGACHFLVPWNATSGSSGDSLYIHDAVVDDPTCVKGDPAVGPSLDTTTTTAGAATTTSVTAAPTTAPTTAPAAFSVSTISLSIQTCKRTGTAALPWVCPLQAHFTLNPGQGGSLAWQVKPSSVAYGHFDGCGGQVDYQAPSQPQPDGTVSSGQTAIDLSGSIAFPDTEVPASAAAVPAQTSQAYAFSGTVQSANAPFQSDAGCKP